MIGFMTGLALSSTQLAIGSLISGTLWSNVRDEISYGRAKDEDNVDIDLGSEWGRAA